MIELSEIKVKEKPKYVEPIKKKKELKPIRILIALILIFIAMIIMFLDLKGRYKIIEEQQAEIDRLQNKVYQQIELIDSLKQVY